MIQNIIHFWFNEHTDKWWKKDPAFDALIKNQFEATYNNIVAGKLEKWLETAEGTLAYIIVTDQFSRNMFRNTGKMFATDEIAVKAAEQGIAQGFDQDCPFEQRWIFYMPFMHSEKLANQDRCIELFKAHKESAPEDSKASIQGNIDFAIKHREIIERFGRYPHRNELLGRESTEQELDFLQTPESSF